MSFRFLLAMALLGLSLPAGLAAAQDAEPNGDAQQARIHFESGRAHYQNGNYRQAVTEWEVAFEHSQLTEILYNLYQAHQRLGNLPEAAQYLGRYLEEGQNVPERDTLEVRLANLQDEIAAQERNAEERAQTDAERERAREDAEAERERAERDAQQAREEAAEERAAHQKGIETRRTAALISFIVGGAGLVTFGVFAGLAAAEDASLASSCGADALRTCTADDVSNLDTFALIADIGLAVGITGAVVGGILWLTTLGGGSDDDDEATARVAPLIGPDLLGAHAEVTF